MGKLEVASVQVVDRAAAFNTSWRDLLQHIDRQARVAGTERNESGRGTP